MNTPTISRNEPTARAAPQPDAGATRAQAARRIKVWDLPTRLFHWLLVAAVTVAILSGREGGEWMALHGQAGLAIVGLLAFRVVWGVLGSTHARFASFVPTPARLRAYVRGRWSSHGHNPLGALSVLAVLGLLAAQAGTGLVANDEIAFTGPLAQLVDEALSLRLTGLHHQLGDVLLWLIGLHLVAIFAYLAIRRNNLIKPMVTGYREAESGQDARGGGAAAFALALAAALLAVYAASGALIPAPPAPPPVPAASATPAAAASNLATSATPAALPAPSGAPAW